MLSTDANAPGRPALIAWLLGGFTLTLFLSFAWYANFQGQSLRLSLARDAFRAKFAAGDFDSAHRLLQIAAETANQLDSRTRKLADETVVQKLLRMAALVAADRAQEARDFFDADLRTGFSLAPAAIRDSLRDSNILPDLGKYLAKYEDAAKEAQAARIELDRVESSERKISSDIESLRAELRTALGLPRPKIEAPDREFYRAGLLAELPVLAELRDDIGSTQELKLELNKLGAALGDSTGLGDSGAKSKALFEKLIGDLRGRSVSLQKATSDGSSRTQLARSREKVAANGLISQRNYLLASLENAALLALLLAKT